MLYHRERESVAFQLLLDSIIIVRNEGSYSPTRPQVLHPCYNTYEGTGKSFCLHLLFTPPYCLADVYLELQTPIKHIVV